jgi:hypothetical protein
MGAAALLLILELVTASNPQSARRSPPAAPELTAEELQVVLAALHETGLREARRFAQSRRRQSAVAVIPDATLASCEEAGTTFCIRESTQSTIARLLWGPNSPLAGAFRSRNSSSSAVAEFGDRIAVIPARELSAVFRPGAGWQEFNQRFGNAALVQFSAPAMEGDQAAVYVVFGCGGLCGKSWLVTLERRGGVFRVRKSHLLTMSCERPGR